MNVAQNIGKALKTLGLMGIMFALAGFVAASAPAASADNTSPTATQGKLVVYVSHDPTPTIVTTKVAVWNIQGELVATGLVPEGQSYTVKLAPGSYKVKVFATDFAEYGTMVNLVSNETTTVKAALSPR